MSGKVEVIRAKMKKKSWYAKEKKVTQVEMKKRWRPYLYLHACLFSRDIDGIYSVNLSESLLSMESFIEPRLNLCKVVTRFES